MLAHDRRGSGPPLILIHGLGSRRQVWDPLVPTLARHYEVITIDLPGFGDSPLWPPPTAALPATGAPTPDSTPPATGAPNSDSAPPSMAAPDSHSARPPTPAGAPPPASIPPAASAPNSDSPSPPTSAPHPHKTAGRNPHPTPEIPPPGAQPPGPQPEPPVPGSVDHLADQVSAFLDDLGLTRPAMAGSSLGGGIALELGRRGRAGAVTVFAPVGFWSPAGRRWCQAIVGAARVVAVALAPGLPRLFTTRIGRVALCGVFYGRPGGLSPEDCLGSARALARAPGFAAARRAFGVRRLPIGADPGALSGIPVTVAWGTRDRILPHRRQSARARDELPAARHVLLPGCGHLPFADDPVRCAELLTPRQ